MIVKIVKQNNQIVKFLQTLEVESFDEELSNDIPSLEEIQQKILPEKSYKHIKELLDEFMEKHSDLKEFEEELEKVKEHITPGQVGEA